MLEGSLPSQIELFSTKQSESPSMSDAPPPPADSQATPLPVDVRTCPSEPCAPPTVRLSVSKVPSMSTLPLISKEPASSSPAIVNKPLEGLYVKPVSVSAPCVPVAPSTNTGYTVSSVELFALTVMLVAKSAVPVTSPVNGPAKASDVTVPSKNASLNSKELVPKSISLSVTGYKAPDVNVSLAALSALKSISFAVPKSIAV